MIRYKQVLNYKLYSLINKGFSVEAQKAIWSWWSKYHHNMYKKNLIQFAQSLILLPFVAGTTVPSGSVAKQPLNGLIETVFTQKQNIGSDEVLALNQVKDSKAKELKAKADAINNYFSKYDMPLLGTGEKMVEEAEKNDLDWRLLPAIAVRESTGGRNQCIKVDFNPFGWGSCKIGFESYDKAIETVAKNLGGNNPNTAKHYDDKTTREILKAYNPPSIVPKYVDQVISIMKAIGPEYIDIGLNSES